MQIKRTWQSSTRHQQGHMHTRCMSPSVRMDELTWDFAAIVITDWQLTHSPVPSFRSDVAGTFARL